MSVIGTVVKGVGALKVRVQAVDYISQDNVRMRDIFVCTVHFNVTLGWIQAGLVLLGDGCLVLQCVPWQQSSSPPILIKIAV